MHDATCGGSYPSLEGNSIDLAKSRVKPMACQTASQTMSPLLRRFAESGPLLCVHIGYPDFLVIARSQRLCRWGMPQFSAHRNARLHSAVEPHAIADAYSAMFGRNAELRPAFPSYIHILARVWRTSLLLDDQPSRSVLGICCTRRYRSCA